MKKLSLVSLACAAVLVITPAALVAQNFDFSSPGNNITIAGVFTLNASPNAANSPYYSYTLASFTGTYTDTLDGVEGTLSLITPIGGTFASPDALEVGNGDVYTYDDQYYPGGAPDAPGAVFDNANSIGLYVSPSVGPADEYYVFLWGNSNGSYEVVDGYTASGSRYAGSPFPPGDSYGFFQNLPASGIFVPETGSLSMLALCVLGLAGGFFCKTRQSGLLLNS